MIVFVVFFIGIMVGFELCDWIVMVCWKVLLKEWLLVMEFVIDGVFVGYGLEKLFRVEVV